MKKKILEALDRMTDIIFAYGPIREKKKRPGNAKEKKKEKSDCQSRKMYDRIRS